MLLNGHLELELLLLTLVDIASIQTLLTFVKNSAAVACGPIFIERMAKENGRV